MEVEGTSSGMVWRETGTIDKEGWGMKPNIRGSDQSQATNKQAIGESPGLFEPLPRTTHHTSAPPTSCPQ